MSDIWHKPPQTPDVFKSHPIIVVYEAGDQIEQMDSKEYSDLVGERYVNRWCYVDDLIKENDRTRKALEIAVDALTRLEKELYFNNAKQTGHIADSVISIPSIALEQITALQNDTEAD